MEPSEMMSKNVEVENAPLGMELEHKTLLTEDAVQFVAAMAKKFDAEIDLVLQERTSKKLQLLQTGKLPDFPVETDWVRSSSWQCDPVPRRLRNRHVDLGDVSPANTAHFVRALRSKAQGIQTDFDDGHCPTWANQLKGLYNVYRATRNKIPGVPGIANAPVLMLRPRAWNMIEHNMLVAGKEVMGPIFDFALLMYHNAKLLYRAESGPFFYLSKVESHKEARLWNNIFIWAQEQLDLPRGTIKATVLIENILASFEMHEILYELREHSAGLNCGIWDYSASFVNKFGTRNDFVLPDRSKYVNMEKHFLKSYMDLVIKTCHGRGTLATGGMSAFLLQNKDCRSPEYRAVVRKVQADKLREIRAGVDGFMVFDLGLVEPMQELFAVHAPSANQLHVLRTDVSVLPSDLLQMPSGGVTLAGLKHNIGVGILFIEAWFRGMGHYFYKGVVEDSATAEISRSQVWQWIRHEARLEDDDAKVTRALVKQLMLEVMSDIFRSLNTQESTVRRPLLLDAAAIFEQVVMAREFPEFITTYLNHSRTFLGHSKHAHLTESLSSKL